MTQRRFASCVQVYLTPAEVQALDQVCDEEQLSRSAVISRLVNAELDKRGLAPVPVRTVRRRRRRSDAVLYGPAE